MVSDSWLILSYRPHLDVRFGGAYAGRMGDARQASSRILLRIEIRTQVCGNRYVLRCPHCYGRCWPLSGHVPDVSGHVSRETVDAQSPRPGSEGGIHRVGPDPVSGYRLVRSWKLIYEEGVIAGPRVGKLPLGP